MDNSNIRDDLKPTGADAAHTVAKASLSSIPVIGGAAAEIFSAVFAPPLNKRRDKWLISIFDGLKRLEEEIKGFKIEELSKNDKFITVAMQASQAAIRNHQAEKLEALRNAVLNAALPNPVEEDIQLMFLHFVDELTPWHLRVLRLFDDPRAWGLKQGITYPESHLLGSSSKVLEHAFPELVGRRAFYDQLARDLFSRGLMKTDSLHTTITAQGMFASLTTDMGKQFINFVKAPVEKV
jgi:hypothetical protein